MNARTLLILTVVVAALGAFIFFVEKDTLSTDERKEQEKKVVALEKDDVTTLEIAWGEKKVRMERHDPPAPDDEDDEEKGDIFAEPEPEWRLVEPLEARADRTEVESLVSTLTSLEKKRTVEDASRSDLGFDEPRGTVTLGTEDGETVIEIGPEVPASSDMLVASGDAVFQVASSVWTDLTKEPGDWRDKELFTARRADIERVTLGSESRVLLAKRGDDFWLESPLTDLADDDLVGGLLADITGLQVESFVDEPETIPAELGLEPAAHVLEIVLAGREEAFRLELGNATDAEEPGAEDADDDGPKTLYARHDGQIVEVETRLLDTFARAPDEWRSRDWTPLEVYRVESARFEDVEGPLEVMREESDWKRGNEKIAYSAVSDVLYAISDAKAKEVLSREEAAARGHALSEPRLRVRLETEDETESLALYPTVDGLAAATREGRDVVLLLAAEDVEEVTSKLGELRQAEPEQDEDEETGDSE